MSATDMYSYDSAMFFAPPTHSSAGAGPSTQRDDGHRLIAHVGPYGELTWYNDYGTPQPPSVAQQAPQKRQVQTVTPFYGHYPTPLEPILESHLEGEAPCDLPPRPRRRQTVQRAATASPTKAKPIVPKARTHSRNWSDTSLSSQSSDSESREVNRLDARLSDLSLYSTPSLSMSSSGPPSPNSPGIQTPPLSLAATVPKDLEMDYDADFIEDVYAAFEFANKDSMPTF